jgi:hypothetical protein
MAHDTGESRPDDICDGCYLNDGECNFDPTDCEADACEAAAEARFEAEREARD